jgi:hypothetical protein
MKNSIFLLFFTAKIIFFSVFLLFKNKIMLLLTEKKDSEEISLFDSLDILAIKYLNETKKMFVYFKKGGRVYEYSNVPSYIYKRIRDAPSQGKKIREVMAKNNDVELYSVAYNGEMIEEEYQSLLSKIEMAKK